MESGEKFSCAELCLEDVCGRLTGLVHTIDTIHLGLKCEKMEQQVLDCVMCIGYAVKGIQEIAEKTLWEIRKEPEQK